MRRSIVLMSLILSALLCSPLLGADLQRHYEGVTLFWAEKDLSWVEVADGVFEKTLANGVTLRRAVGVEGLTWLVNRFTQHREELLAATGKEGPTEKAARTLRMLEYRISSLNNQINKLRQLGSRKVTVRFGPVLPRPLEGFQVHAQSNELEYDDAEQVSTEGTTCSTRLRQSFWSDTPCSTHTSGAWIECDPAAQIHAEAYVSTELLGDKTCERFESHDDYGTSVSANVSCGGYWWSTGYSEWS